MLSPKKLIWKIVCDGMFVELNSPRQLKKKTGLVGRGETGETRGSLALEKPPFLKEDGHAHSSAPAPALGVSGDRGQTAEDGGQKSAFRPARLHHNIVDCEN